MNLRKADPAFDPNPRGSNCPHLAANLKLWHDPATWPSGKVPSPSDTIVLPANTAILASACSFHPTDMYLTKFKSLFSIDNRRYESISVPAGSALIFDDAPIDFHVKQMNVYQHFPPSPYFF